MSAVINTNIAAIRTHNVYNRNNDYMNQALTKVATGQKINSAKDGASTWAISEKMRERIRANDQANQNVQNDQALLKTAQGGIGNTLDILKTIKERAINAANDSNINTDRGAIQTEINQLLAQINDNATKVKFNGRTLLNGAAGDDSTTATAAASSSTAAASTTYTYTAAGITLASSVSDGSNANNTTVPTGDTVLKSLYDTYATANSISVGTAVDIKLLSSGLYESTSTVDTSQAISDNLSAATGTITKTSGGDYQLNGVTGGASYYTRVATTPTGGSTVSNPDVTSGTATTQGSSLNFFIGGEDGSGITFSLASMTTADITGLSSGIDVTTASNAASAIANIDSAIQYVLNEQTKVGAMETRLGYTADNITTMNENLEAADSVMRDSDIAKEMTNYMKYSVLAQASQYMLAQAGQNAFSVLNLLQA